MIVSIDEALRYPVITRPVAPDWHPWDMAVPEDFAYNPGETLLYAFFDDENDGLLLYVGITERPVERWLAHRRRAEWWPMISGLETTLYATRAIAAHYEALVIAEEPRPLFNRAGNPDWRRPWAPRARAR